MVNWRWLTVGVASLSVVAGGCGSPPTDESAPSTAIESPPELVDGGAVSAELDVDSAVSAEGQTFEPEPGELVWIHDAEPPDLHVDDPDNKTEIASWVREGLIEGLFGIDGKISFYPELLAADPVPTVNEDGTIVLAYELRPDLRWSDGEPLTAEDVAYTHQILIEGCVEESDGSIVDNSNDGCEYELARRTGYDLVTGFEVASPTSFTVTMASFFPAWRDLYSQVLAEHAFGADAAAVNDNLRRWRGDGGVLPSSGPLVLDEWERGVSIKLARNDAYHGSVSPDAENGGPAQVDSVRILFVADREARIDAVLAGRAHLLFARPEPAYTRLSQSTDFTVAASPGADYEHWGLNLLNPHLAKPQVREAIAYALDKNQLVAESYQPLAGGALPEDGVGNVYWMPNQAGYVDHQQKYQGSNVVAAAEALRSADYVAGSDGVWSHPDTGRLSLRVGTTGGNALRERMLEVGQAQLAQAGIELRIDNEPGGLFLTQGPFAAEALEASASAGRSGDPDLWDIAQFAWATGPWPGAVTGTYRSGSAGNPYGFNNPEFDVAATECDGLADDSERADCYNALDVFVTTLDEGDDGLFVIPVTQRPRFYGYASNLLTAGGIAPDTLRGGPLVNVVDFRFSE